MGGCALIPVTRLDAIQRRVRGSNGGGGGSDDGGSGDGVVVAVVLVVLVVALLVAMVVATRWRLARGSAQGGGG